MMLERIKDIGEKVAGIIAGIYFCCMTFVIAAFVISIAIGFISLCLGAL